MNEEARSDQNAMSHQGGAAHGGVALADDLNLGGDEAAGR